MSWALAAGSFAAVLMLSGIAWALKLGGTGRVASEAEAIRLAEEAIAGFEASNAAVCANGRGALVFGQGGSVALIRPSGARFIVREARRPRWQASGSTLTVESEDRVPLRLELERPEVVGERLDGVVDSNVNRLGA